MINNSNDNLVGIKEKNPPLWDKYFTAVCLLITKISVAMQIEFILYRKWYTR